MTREGAIERSPLKLGFSTWREAVVCLRARVNRKGVPVSPDEFGELLAERVGRGSARAWTAWSRGLPEVKLAEDEVRRALRCMASLFIDHWTPLVRGGTRARTAEESELVVERIAQALGGLPRHAPPARAATPVSGASLRSLVNRYLVDHRLRHQDLAQKLSTRLREDPRLCELLDDEGDAVEPWHVQRIASGQGLDLDRPAYYLFVRAFAALTRHDAVHYFALPFDSLGAPPEWGVFLHVRLTGLSAAGGTEHPGAEAVTAAFREVAEQTFARVVSERMLQGQRNRYGEFETSGSLVPSPAGDGAFEITLRLKPRLQPPPSSVYGPALLLFVEYARQVRLAFSLHELNLSRLCAGAPPFGTTFTLHAGIAERDRHRELRHCSTGIHLTGDAYYHARTTDLRLVWENVVDMPSERQVRPSEEPDAVHGVRAFQSHIYFGEIPLLTSCAMSNGPERRCVELAEAKPGDTFLRIELATSLFQRGLIDEALRVAQSVTAVDVRHPTAWALVSVCFANLARSCTEALDDDGALHLDAVARLYHRSLSAAKLGLESDPTQEDAHDSLGCLHLLRALDCFRWYDSALVSRLESAGPRVRYTLLQSGFDWAEPERVDQSVVELLRRAALADFTAACHHFDRGLDVSATKSRSFFWRLIADALLSAVTGAGADVRKAQMLRRFFLEVGWITTSDSDARVLEVLAGKIEDYDASVLLESYLPDVQLAYAVAYWDFVGPTKETARRARGHLERALSLVSARPPGAEARPAVVRCWGYLQRVDAFTAAVRAAAATVGEWESRGAYTPIFPLYLGDTFSRAFPEFLRSLASGA